MRNNFRQGIISYQKDGNGSPQFLLASQTAGYIQLNVAPSPTLITFAHGDADYLAAFDVTNPTAWGPLIANQDNYLYWDMDVLTGAVTQGITTLEPVVSSVEPQNPGNGLHWFDLNTKKMKVWSLANARWQERIRLFAGLVENGNSSQLVPRVVGSQVGLNTISNPGWLMLDSQLHPLRTSDGSFLTSDTRVRIKTTVGTSGVLATPPNAFIPVRAGENIPAMSLVYFSGPDTVSLATSDPAALNEKTPVGIIQESLATNQIGNLTQSGDITYDQWDWSASIGKAVYSNSSGQLTAARPAGLLAYRVGFVKNKNTIVFGVDAETAPQVYNSSPTQLIISGSAPLVATDTVNGIGERVVTLSIPAATSGAAGYMTAVQATALGTFDTRITANELAINQLQTNKANVSHTHVPADVIGLQALLDGKMAANKLFDDRYSLLNHNHDGRYALLAHTHAIADVSGLQTSLDSKSDRFTGLLPFSRIYTSVNQSGAVDGGVGQTLADVLAGKSNVGHTHAISDITNLVDELNNRAMLNHTHSIAQVTGLQTALNALTADVATKANINHTHAIADVTNLQTTIDGINTALAGKAPTSHTHTTSQITDINSWLTTHVQAGSNVTIGVSNGVLTINSDQSNINIPDPLVMWGVDEAQTSTAQYVQEGGLWKLKVTGDGQAFFTSPVDFSTPVYYIDSGTGNVAVGKPSANTYRLEFSGVSPGGMILVMSSGGPDLASPTTMNWTTGKVRVRYVPGLAIMRDGLIMSGDDSPGGSTWVDVRLALKNLTDVDVVNTQPNDGDALVWDNTDGIWKPGTVSSGGGGGGTQITVKDYDELNGLSASHSAFYDGTNSRYVISVSSGSGDFLLESNADRLTTWDWTTLSNTTSNGSIGVQYIDARHQRFTFSDILPGEGISIVFPDADNTSTLPSTITSADWTPRDQSISYATETLTIVGAQVTNSGLETTIKIPQKTIDLLDVDANYAPLMNQSLVFGGNNKWQPKFLRLYQLEDVSDSLSPNNGNVLMYNNTTSMWEAGDISGMGGGGGATQLADLTDVDFGPYNEPDSGEFLTYNGTKWVSKAPADAGILGNVSSTTPDPFSELAFNGSLWDKVVGRTVTLKANPNASYPPGLGTSVIATSNGLPPGTGGTFGNGVELQVPAYSAAYITGTIVAFNYTTGAAATWTFKTLATNPSTGVLSLNSTSVTPDLTTGTVTGWDVAIAANTATQSVRFTCSVTGSDEVNFTIRAEVART